MTGGYRPWSKFNAHSWSNLNARRHPVLKRLFGFKRMANFNAVIRLFNKFTQVSNEAVMDSLYRCFA